MAFAFMVVKKSFALLHLNVCIRGKICFQGFLQTQMGTLFFIKAKRKVL